MEARGVIPEGREAWSDHCLHAERVHTDRRRYTFHRCLIPEALHEPKRQTLREGKVPQFFHFLISLIFFFDFLFCFFCFC